MNSLLEYVVEHLLELVLGQLSLHDLRALTITSRDVARVLNCAWVWEQKHTMLGHTPRRVCIDAASFFAYVRRLRKICNICGHCCTTAPYKQRGADIILCNDCSAGLTVSLCEAEGLLRQVVDARGMHPKGTKVVATRRAIPIARKRHGGRHMYWKSDVTAAAIVIGT